MSICQNLGIILENKVVKKLKLENNDFSKKWSPQLILLNGGEKNMSIFDIENYGNFGQTVIH